jgi:hypothetical protein
VDNYWTDDAVWMNHYRHYGWNDPRNAARFILEQHYPKPHVVDLALARALAEPDPGTALEIVQAAVMQNPGVGSWMTVRCVVAAIYWENGMMVHYMQFLQNKVEEVVFGDGAYQAADRWIEIDSALPTNHLHKAVAVALVKGEVKLAFDLVARAAR